MLLNTSVNLIYQGTMVHKNKTINEPLESHCNHLEPSTGKSVSPYYLYIDYCICSYFKTS